ncbi:hypothetical protein [Henriciella aquimarina]|uniref:hypothetical protein n=1 Tax=Henriciella aquimarina TaxID=545261 RepID=UPI001301D6C7|nr:hypothetical protein [Henriciella aquimarina]
MADRPLPDTPISRPCFLALAALPIAFSLVVILIHFTAPELSAWLFEEGWPPVEMSQVIIPLIGAGLAIFYRGTRQTGHIPLMKPWLIIFALGCVYIAGEEASWGQHFFGWSTGEGWSAINVQDETNLHNTSAWLNHKPRALVQLAALFTLILAPAIRHMEKLSDVRQRFGVFLPGPVCMSSAATVIFWILAEEARKSFGMVDLVPRESEAQETALYLFIVTYIYELGRRLPLRRATSA